ncbi:nuclear transport factor 2 family protein [Pseudotenacibaculum haliotis]|uniref:Nuclear transport factor 2 family protein n=1 Tax=Pseudotenacibaculum haliotis TaxID=1862138 RepID=A0ABW5LLY4_9FLAO
MNSYTAHWHEVVTKKDPEILSKLLADDVVFHSPVVHSPQKGKKITEIYLLAALQVFLSGEFKYVREVENDQCSFLEFEVELDGVLINGIDMITWNEEGKIIDFKVMIRPLKAINLVHQKMGEILLRR